MLRKSSFCAYDYSKIQQGSSQAASVEASYKLFDAGASGSTSSSSIIEKQTNVCAGVFGSEKYSSLASQFAQNVYQGSLDAWNRCQALSQQGVNFDLQTDQSGQGATVTLSTTSSGTSVNFNGLDQIGLGRSICTTTRNSNTGSSTGKVLTVDKTTSLKFNSASKLTITCERQMSSDGKGGLFADAQTLVFNTSAGSYQVPMVTIGLSPRVTVDQAVANLQSSVNSQIAQVKTDYQKAISDAAPTDTLNSLQNQIAANKPICTAVTSQSPIVGCGEAKTTANLPSGYTLVGGGCNGSNATRYLIASVASGNGWYCHSQDRDVCASGYVAAYAIGCNFH